MKTCLPCSIKASCVLLVTTLGACGDGGSMGYTAPVPPSSTTTASFAQPASPTIINLGQAVTLQWSSTHSGGCAATVSGADGGSFTGNQAATGTATVVPTAPGTYTYMLSCSGMGGNASATTPAVTVSPSILIALSMAGKITTIGSTVDPVNGDQNPYGLAIAPATAGLITKGDLIVCNFNNAGTPANQGGVQGTGTTLIGLHPTAGSKPYRIAQSANLDGCNALTMLPDDSISAAAWSATNNPLVGAGGVVTTPYSDTFAYPWGEAYVAAAGSQPAAIYVSNAPGGDIAAGGTIDRISLDNDAQTTFAEIAHGFCSSGSPGMIFGPAGLTYDPSNDTLYVVDTSSASVIAIVGISGVSKDGLVVNGQCTGTPPTPVPTFSGPSMTSARVIAHGPPLNTPLSAALLKNGDLVVANADIGVQAPSAATNLLIEVSPLVPGGFVGKPVQLDNTAPGALFGLATAVDSDGNQVIYFNDDNAAAVLELTTTAATTSPPSPYSTPRTR